MALPVSGIGARVSRYVVGPVVEAKLREIGQWDERYFMASKITAKREPDRQTPFPMSCEAVHAVNDLIRNGGAA